MFGAAAVVNLRLSSGYSEGFDVSGASSCLNNKTIEEFQLSDGSPCSLISVDTQDVDSFQKYAKCARHFHFSDFLAKNPNCSNEEKAAYENVLNARLEKIKLEFSSGKQPLVIIQKAESIIGGSFYVFKENNLIVLMQAACVDRDISKEDNELCFAKIIGYLSNGNYFPDSSKFVVFARKWSEEVDILKKLCSVSEFSLPEYNPEYFTSYERPVV